MFILIKITYVPKLITPIVKRKFAPITITPTTYKCHCDIHIGPM
jgi:hypothetical protein